MSEKNQVKMTKRRKLLVIDDNQQFLAILKSFLSQKYDIITAYKGLDGLKVFEEHGGNIDLVITDLVMPEISGVGVISLIKSRYPGTPVIAITGRGEHPAALATEADADAVLNKPFDLVDLDCRVTELLEKKS